MTADPLVDVCPWCEHSTHGSGECDADTGYDHLNGFHECGCEGIPAQVKVWLAEHVAKPEVVEAVAEAIYDETRDIRHARAALAALLETLEGEPNE